MGGKVLDGSFAHLATGLKIHREFDWHLWRVENHFMECSRWLLHTPVTSTPPHPPTPSSQPLLRKRVEVAKPPPVYLSRFSCSTESVSMTTLSLISALVAPASESATVHRLRDRRVPGARGCLSPPSLSKAGRTRLLQQKLGQDKNTSVTSDQRRGHIEAVNTAQPCSSVQSTHFSISRVSAET